MKTSITNSTIASLEVSSNPQQNPSRGSIGVGSISDSITMAEPLGRCDRTYLKWIKAALDSENPARAVALFLQMNRSGNHLWLQLRALSAICSYKLIPDADVLRCCAALPAEAQEKLKDSHSDLSIALQTYIKAVDPLTAEFIDPDLKSCLF